jgi:hypothetical protein
VLTLLSPRSSGPHSETDKSNPEESFTRWAMRKESMGWWILHHRPGNRATVSVPPARGWTRSSRPLSRRCSRMLGRALEAADIFAYKKGDRH